MKVNEIMTTKIEVIDADASLYDAVEKMIDKRLRCLVVRPKTDKDVYGVITARDIVFKAIGKNLDLNRVKVEEIAVKPVICVNKDMDLAHVISLMQNFNIARVFVCEGAAMVGIVSLMDVMSGTLIERAKGGRGV
ncbi:MAG TPA: CBS domain-containing protein [Dissulfurispiraceae bacterium]|nr:CBS domain-containing protein [Dissulfurispiraceae bacterium]